jgi:hypothetical protein
MRNKQPQQAGYKKTYKIKLTGFTKSGYKKNAYRYVK